MAVVIDEMSATVDPGSGSGESGENKHQGAAPATMAPPDIAAELKHFLKRQMRLQAD